MSVSLRSQLVSGVALVGAGAIALTPIQPAIAPAVSPARISSQTVALAAAVDPITAWLDVWNSSEQAFAAVSSQFLKAPAASGQQMMANGLRYLTELPDFTGIVDQIVTNWQNSAAAAFTLDKGGVNNENNLDALHKLAFSLLPQLLPPDIPPALIDFTTTWTSGALIGDIGPIVAPFLALGNSFKAVGEAVKAGQWRDAITELINIPANMTKAFFVGGPLLDLTALVNKLLPPPTQLDQFAIVMGGLFTPANPLFNSVSVNLAGIQINGVPAGPMGSTFALGQQIAKVLGWDGTGNPLKPGIPVPGSAAGVAAPAATAPKAAAAAVAPPSADDAPAVAAPEPAAPEPAAPAPTVEAPAVEAPDAGASDATPAAPPSRAGGHGKRGGGAGASDDSGSSGAKHRGRAA
ncbi:MAG: outer membrane porin GjpA [Mycobacterium sp.]